LLRPGFQHLDALRGGGDGIVDQVTGSDAVLQKQAVRPLQLGDGFHRHVGAADRLPPAEILLGTDKDQHTGNKTRTEGHVVGRLWRKHCSEFGLQLVLLTSARLTGPYTCCPASTISTLGQPLQDRATFNFANHPFWYPAEETFPSSRFPLPALIGVAILLIPYQQ